MAYPLCGSYPLGPVISGEDPGYNHNVSGEEAILDEAMENLKEAGQRIRATQARLWSADMEQHPNYRELCQRLSVALAMTEAAYLEARRCSGPPSR
jgi:hypothetical protein